MPKKTLELQNWAYLSKLALSQFLLEGELVSGELSHGRVSASEQIHADSSDGVGAAVHGLLEADDVRLRIVGRPVWTTGRKGSTGGAGSWCGNTHIHTLTAAASVINLHSIHDTVVYLTKVFGGLSKLR